MTFTEQTRQVKCLSFIQKACKECPLGNRSDARCYREGKIEGDGPYSLRVFTLLTVEARPTCKKLASTTRGKGHRIEPQGMGSQGLFPGLYCLFATPRKMQQANHFETPAPGQRANASGLIQPNSSVDETHIFGESPHSLPPPHNSHTFQHHNFPLSSSQLELWELC